MRRILRFWLSAIILGYPFAQAAMLPNAGPFPASPATTSAPYSFTFSPSGGAGGPYTYSVTSGTLPAGLSLTSPTVLSGTPAVPGSYPLTFTVTDNGGLSNTVSGTLTVNAGALAAYTTLASWQAASAGTLTSITLPGTPGGNVEYSGNTVTLSSVAFSAGTLNDCGGIYPNCASNTPSGWFYSLEVGDHLRANLPAAVNVTAAGGDYGAYFGNNPQTDIVTGATFSGLSLTVTITAGTGTAFVGFVSSNPSDPVASMVANTGSTSNGPALSDFSYYSSAWPTLSILNTSPLPLGTTNSGYNVTMVGSGGSGQPANYFWSATGLPAGLSMSTAGAITGTAAAGGTANVQITLTDAQTGQSTGPQTFSMTILQGTATALTSSLGSPSVLGKPITLTASVTPNTVTGPVTFYNGAAVLGTSNIVSGQAVLNTSLLPTGVNNLRAFYPGNAATLASSSTVLAQTVRSNAQNGFQTAVLYTPGAGAAGTFSVVTGDFNGDGIPDLAAANFSSSPGNVAILLGNGNGTFRTAVTYTAGTQPRAIAVGDFNGDGNTDLAVANTGSNNVSILLGNGNGTFQAQATYSVGSSATGPNGIVVADFNGDGNADLAVVDSNSGNVSILPGTGTGTFGAASLLSTGAGSNPSSLLAGDFNGDGLADLAVVNNVAGNISVFLGQGGGLFVPAVTYGLGSGASGPITITAGDFNGDGILDLVTANYSTNNISVLIGASNGTFGAATVIGTGSTTGPFYVAVGDFNGDGKADIVTANEDATTIGVLTGDGAGNFAAPVIYPIGGAVQNPAWLAVADFNEDGISDLAVANESTANISVLLGLIQTTTVLTSSVNPSTYGQTTTLTATVSPLTAAGSVGFFDGATQIGLTGLSGGTTSTDVSNLTAGTHSLTAVYNGDIFDARSTSAPISQTVAQAGTTTNVVSSLNPSSPGQQITFTATVSIPTATGPVTFKDGATTLGTGLLDGGSGVVIFQTSSLGSGIHAITAVYAGDANDLASISPIYTQTVQSPSSVVLSTSANPATADKTITLTATLTPSDAGGNIDFFDGPTLLGSVPSFAGIANLQISTLAAGTHSLSAVYGGDSDDTGSTSNTLTETVQNATTIILAVPGVSVFGASATLAATLSPASATGVVEFYDGSVFLGTAPVSNGDAAFSTRFLQAGTRSITARYAGDAFDLPGTSAASPQLVNANPIGGFEPPAAYTAANNPAMITQADFNGDGKTDIAVVDQGDTGGQGTVEVFLGNSDGTFQAPTTIHFPAGQNLDWITAADFNNDGNADLAVAGRTPGKVFVLMGDGAGGFGTPATYATTGAPFQTAIAVGDFNGDGFADLAVSGDDGNAAILLNTGAGTFNVTSVAAGPNPYGVTAGDFNNDGFTDLAFANFSNDLITILPGNGDGTFGALQSQQVPAGSGPFYIATTDLNGDGVLDLAVTNLSLGGITVLLGDPSGNGTFPTVNPYFANITKASGLAFGDFNGDGKIDIAVTSFTSAASSVSVLAGDGSGSFVSSTTYTGGAWPLGIVVGDFNGDGRPDIATANGNTTTSNVSVLLSTVPTTTALVSSLNPSTFGANITLTATVAPASATGTVTFSDGATVLGTGTLSGGTATLNISVLSVGAHSLTAAYGGDTNDAASTSSILAQTVNQAPTLTILASSLNPSTFGASVTLTAAVSPSTATGIVTFKDGATILGTGTLSGGAVTLNISTLSVASHLLTAVYSGDANDVAGTSAILAQTVNQAPTTTTLTSLLNPSTFGASVTLTATVAPSTATGTVTFKDGATILGAVTLSGGTVTLNISTLSVASHSLTAAYSGDTNDLAGTSGILAQTVNQAPTTTTLTSSLNPSIFGASVTLTAALAPSTATGTVTFKDGATTLGTGTLSGGTATLNISTLSVASHSLTAVYGSDTNDAAGTSSILTQTVNQIATVITLTSSANPATFDIPLTLTATLASSIASGTVIFKDGAATIGTGTLSGGVATLTTSALAFGPHSLTASYGGDANNTAGQSSVLMQNVVFSPLLIVVSSLPPGQAGVAYGPVTLQGQGGSGSYSWSATGLPAGISLSSSGTLSGISAVAFSGSIAITLTDTVSHNTLTNSFTLTVAPSSFVISGTGNLGAVVAGGAVSGAFSASGGTPPYTWSLSGAPGGLSVDAKGDVSGVAGQAGNFSFTLVAKDSTPTNPLTASIALTLSAFGLTTTSLPPASTLSGYSAGIGAAGGAPPYSFSASGLPGGLSLTGATIGGRATTPGSYTVSVRASDSKGLSVSSSLSLTVTGTGPLQVTSGALADGVVNKPYSQTLSAEGGSPGYTWSSSGGVLPPGLALGSSGTIFGTPTQPGSYSAGVQAKDTSGGQAVGTISINIGPETLQITTGSPLPEGVADAAYPTQILNAAGGVAPYTFALKGSLPDGLTLSNGQIAGTPGTPGTFGFSLVVTDSATPPAPVTAGTSITIRPSSADLVLSAGTASFNLTPGISAPPSPAAVTVSSSVTQQILNFTVDSSTAPWVTVSGGSTTPAALSIGLTDAALALSPSGSPYSGAVVVTCTSGSCAGKSQSIAVSVNVVAPPPQLSLSSSIFSFVASSGNPQSSSAALGIQNSGGGSLTINSITAADSWISVGSYPAAVLPGPGAAVTVTADPGTLPAGYYTSSVTVSTSAGSASVPVTLLISPKATMVLGPSGTQFSVPQGGTLGNSTGSFLVSVSSTSAVTFAASVLPGASWLAGGGSGSATNASPGTVSFSLDSAAVAALPAGAYYGTIRVTGTGIVNTPQDFQVVLSVSSPAVPVAPDPQPGGLLFLSSSPGPLAPQTIQVFASSTAPLPFQASAVTNSGSGWLSISSTTGTSQAGSAAQITASVDSTGLKPGIYSGGVSFASGPEVRTVNVTLVVETPLSVAGSLAPAVSSPKPADSAPLCANAQLAPAPTGLVSSFAAPASWPTPISVTLVDTCGSIIGHGQIVATFSNGDPPLALSPVDVTAGLYSGTWTPRRSSSQTVITAQATASGYAPASVQIAGQVIPNAAPELTPNGTLDIFNPQVGGGLGPGNIVQIYGTSLASQPTSVTTLPLPTKVAGTQVLIGGITAPLFYVSPTQVNAQIPFELQAGQQYQVIVNANGALTTPQPIQLNAGVPALLQFTSGLVIAQHPDGTLVSGAAPAAPGEYIVLYMTGLGATDIPVPSGQPSPSNPPANVLDVPVLTLDTTPVPLLFAGLTPGLVGLYQINIQIPAGLPDKTYNLQVAQDGVVSNSTSLPVQTPPPAAQ